MMAKPMKTPELQYPTLQCHISPDVVPQGVHDCLESNSCKDIIIADAIMLAVNPIVDITYRVEEELLDCPIWDIIWPQKSFSRREEPAIWPPPNLVS